MIAPRSGPHDPEALRRRLVDVLSLETAASQGLETLCRSLTSELGLSGTTIVLMVDDGTQGLVAASDAETMLLDRVQFDVGEGPSREAFATGRPVLVYDLAGAGGRWPGFVADPRTRGLGAVYAFPLQQGAVRLGVLTGYCTESHPLTPDDVSRCVVHAEVATQYLIAARHHRDGEPPGFLQDDVRIRTEVYQAQGIVTVDLGVGLAEALVRMRATAFAEGLTLNDLAVQIVSGERRLAATAEPDPPLDPPLDPPSTGPSRPRGSDGSDA